MNTSCFRVSSTSFSRTCPSLGRSYEQEISDAYLENIQQGYFDFLRQQQNNMRILLLDTNDLDFVANEKDYQRIIEAINQPYEIGLHRISL